MGPSDWLNGNAGGLQAHNDKIEIRDDGEEDCKAHCRNPAPLLGGIFQKWWPLGKHERPP